MQKIAEQLLGRALNKKDGISKHLIALTEKRLGFMLPQALRSFYLHVGNNQRFSQSFDRFLMLDDLKVEHQKLIFLAENQHVCWWAIDVTEVKNESTNQELTVYQTPSEGDFFSEHIDLTSFIQLIMYYQLAQGGYDNCASINLDEKDKCERVLQLLTLDNTWQKVVDHNHLLIFCKESQLIWYFTNNDDEVSEMLFASTLFKKDLNVLVKTFGFSDLN